MKIFHILGYLAQRYGGPPQVALNMGKALESQGVRIDWWATASRTERGEFEGYEDHVHLFTTAFPHSWYYSPTLRQALEDQIQYADVVHLHQVWDYPLFTAARLAQRYDKPYLVTPHGIFSQPWRYNSFKKSIYLSLFAKPFLNRASCLHAITPAELPGFHTAGLRPPAVVIPNGIDLEKYLHLPSPSTANATWPQLENKIVVLFLGRLSPEKGLDILIEAWARLVQIYRDAILMLAGPDFKGYRQFLVKRIYELRLQESILLPGLLDEKRKLQAFSRADIYVQPSYSEGFSMAILEALAAGKPCVITENCNFSQVAQVRAGLVIPADIQALINALGELMGKDDNTRLAMGKRGQRLIASEYTWQKIAHRMLELYRHILDGSVSAVADFHSVEDLS